MKQYLSSDPSVWPTQPSNNLNTNSAVKYGFKRPVKDNTSHYKSNFATNFKSSQWPGSLV